MVTLDAGIRLVTLQFSFSNAEGIPAVLKQQNPETLREFRERKTSVNGTMVIEPTEMCSLLEFLDDLKAAGYQLVDAFYKPRIDGKDKHMMRTYHMVRFLFARSEHAGRTPEFEQIADDALAALYEICSKSLWRVRSFVNPFHDKAGVNIEGQSVLSVNLEVRTPLYRPDGHPVTQWKKDENGQKLGTAPLPLQPNHVLRVVDAAVGLHAAQ